MSQPSVAQLVSAVRSQLAAAILPSIEDPGQQKLLAMVDHILQTVQIRSEHEIEWMVNHTKDIVALASDCVRAGEAAPQLVEALDRYRVRHRETLHTSEVTADYGLAAEILSALLETTLGLGGDTARRAQALLAADVARGVEVVGEFSLVPP
jgi:hypothetical protein